MGAVSAFGSVLDPYGVTHNAKGTMVDQYTYFGWEVLCEAVLCLRFDVTRGEIIPLRKASSGEEQASFYDESYDAYPKTPMISNGGGGNRILSRHISNRLMLHAFLG